MDIIGRKHIVRHITLVEIDMRPLTTLSLMTRHGIGILNLKSVIILIALQFFDAVGLETDIGIILHHSIVELQVLLMRQSRSLGREGIETNNGCEFEIIVIGKLHGYLSKTEAIELMHVPTSLHHRYIAIGEERY